MTLTKLIKWILVTLSIIVFVAGISILIINIDPTFARDMIWTEDAALLYSADPEAYTVYEVKVSPDYTRDGNFFVSNVRYAPTSGQLVMTVRFNKSTLKHADEFYETGNTAWDDFRYVLHDRNGNYYGETAHLHLDRGRHHYIRIIFDGIPPEAEEELLLAVYHIDHDEAPFGEIRIFHEKRGMVHYRIKDREIPAGATPDLIFRTWLPAEADSADDPAQTGESVTE